MEHIQSVPLQDRLPLQGDSKSTEKHTLDKEKTDLSFLKSGGPRIVEIIDEVKAFSGPVPFDPLSALAAAKIDLTKELKPPESALVIRNSNGEFTTVATLGNFQVVLGKAKSKKTFYCTLVVGAILNELPVGKLKGVLPDGKKVVLVFDTEQSPYHVQRTAGRILNAAGLRNTNLLNVYALRKYTYKERVQIIEAALQSHVNVGFVVIDGLRDLIADINDPTEAVLVVGKLMKWTEEYNIHIMCILHQNKGDENARGHLGTEAVNKAETVLSVSRHPKIKEISIVKAEYCRDKDPDEFAFTVNEEGFAIPISDDDFTAIPRQDGDTVKKAYRPEDIDDLNHRDIISNIFSKQPKYSGKELVENIISEWRKKGMEFGTNAAVQFRIHYVDKKWIAAHGKDNSPKRFYTLTNSIT